MKFKQHQRDLRFFQQGVFFLSLILLTVGGCSDTRARLLFQTATSHAAQGQWAQAIHYYESLWVQYPQADLVDEAKMLAARIYAGPEKKSKSAEDLYRDIILHSRQETVRKQAMLELADLYLSNTSQLEAAIEMLDTYTRGSRDPNEDSLIKLKLLQLYIHTGELMQAINLGQTLTQVKNSQQQIQAYLGIAQAQELARILEEALKNYDYVCQHAQSKSQEWLAAMEGKARVESDLKRWQTVLITLEALKPLHPNPSAIEHWQKITKQNMMEQNK